MGTSHLGVGVASRPVLASAVGGDAVCGAGVGTAVLLLSSKDRDGGAVVGTVSASIMGGAVVMGASVVVVMVGEEVVTAGTSSVVSHSSQVSPTGVSATQKRTTTSCQRIPQCRRFHDCM